MPRLLDDISFREPARARGAFEQLTIGLAAETSEQIERTLNASPDPDGALAYLVRLRELQPEAFNELVPSRAALRYLVTVFSQSRFLSEELLQNPLWIRDLLESGDMHRVRLREEFIERLQMFLGSIAGASAQADACATPDALAFALVRRKAILRILLRDVLGFGTLSEVTEELSYLADAILEVAYRRIRADLVRRYGRPMAVDESGKAAECGFAVIALGKLGGLELNYSSDIDLMFVYSENGETEGPQRISNKEFFKKLANQLTDLLSTYTAEGLCYRVDLRLRPEGRLGEVCISLEGAKAYYRSRARDWELQMLIKGRAAAGDLSLGRELLDFVEPLTYTSTLDFSAVESMSATRDRIDERLAARRSGSAAAAFDIKLARGGIRDIEFLVQCLQRLHGGRTPWVRHAGTLLALSRLHDKALLSETEYWRLASAYQFLRHLEHRLQFVDDRQTHALPSDPEELALLARRMPAEFLQGEPTRERLWQELNAHLEQVTVIYERIIHAQKPIYYTLAVDAPSGGVDEPAGVDTAKAAGEITEPVASNLVRSLDQSAPSLAAQIGQANLKRGLRAFEHFLERILPNAEWMSWLNEEPVLTGFVLDLFEHSPYFAEELIRHPELLAEVRAVASDRNGKPAYMEGVSSLTEPGDLRRFFRREMMRTQAESICLHAPIFDTLGRTSDLADAVITAAYRIALEHARAAKPPQDVTYEPVDQLMVIALGRLGMREFDLASDADLLFVIPDRDSAEQLFWTRVAEKMINILTAYTAEGVMFAIDTRLRPNGREGALVQTVGNYKEYFARNAEAWEGIAYMKARAVAGNLEAATEFLHQLQDVDWRRYGQSGRSKNDLRQMRLRVEKEQGASSPLKAGRGGFYDIDFALMYLRLKGAGLFFKVLNTPERIDLIERMGHLDREDAAFLLDAAVFYRSVDHGLRVSSGHAEGMLPTSEAKLEMLEALVRRWIPDRMRGEPLRVQMSHIQDRTRALFERLFA
jgi:glutamate-ammonia-ligase adenylyltransferase